MISYIILITSYIILISFAGTDDDIFKDYCKSGLCEHFGGDGQHSGCKNGVPHDGNFQKPPCPDNVEKIELTEEDKQAILDTHNFQRNYVAGGGLAADYNIRAGCRIGALIWDKELEATAFLHVSYCIFAHDKCRNTVKYPFSGQNLGIMNYKPGKIRATQEYINIIHYLWFIEYRLVDIKTLDSYYNQKEMVGHFLTQVNERNNRIGCAFAKFYREKEKTDSVMLSCNYPTTNIARGGIYNTCKKPASKCTSGTDPKYKYLCSTTEPYDVVTPRLEHIPFDGDGSETYDAGIRPEDYQKTLIGTAFIEKQEKDNPSKPPKKPIGMPGTTGQPGNAGQPITKPTHKPDQPIKHPGYYPEGNPLAGGVSDYSDAEYDPEDGGATVPWHDLFYQSTIMSLMITITNVLFII